MKRGVKREAAGKQQVFRGSIRKYKPLVGAGPPPTGPVPFERMFRLPQLPLTGLPMVVRTMFHVEHFVQV